MTLYCGDVSDRFAVTMVTEAVVSDNTTVTFLKANSAYKGSLDINVLDFSAVWISLLSVLTVTLTRH